MDLKQQTAYMEAVRRLGARGKAEHAAIVRAAYDADEPLEEGLEAELVYGQPVEAVPAFNYAPAEAIPRRKGQGSGKEVWRQFAKEYSDIDPEVIDQVDKKDLIQMLEVNGVIPE